MEFILPMYEQAKVQEQKSIPTIMVGDKAVAPELKYAPKKSFIILFIFFIALFLILPFVFVGEKYVNKKELDNILAVKVKNFYSRVRKIYKIRDID